ncbi:Rne/Rng family ribonuclease [Alkalilacustris brevis]|uniref:Rne/Rng family ribonuclease n=1 Tax=Alkalilacustris brevis TaxID=2026338 RepID=UPI000E0DBE6E|nr:ribonuclease E/G [Alkalilacustris brevis]
MANKMLIDATHAEETRVVVVDGNKVEEFDFEAANRRQLAGNIYLAKVTRVEPSLQAAFVDYGGNRHGFLAFSEIHPDYYQIPSADREALLAEERAYAAAQAEGEQNGGGRKGGGRRRAAKAEAARDESPQVASDVIPGMDVVEFEPESDDAAATALPVADTAETDTSAPVDQADASTDADEAAQADDSTSSQGDDQRPYAAVDHAAEIDDQIESIADEDVTEEIRISQRVRQKRYKIQEVIKVRQILLVQVVKEERGNKGAALTTYLSLAGRYCVLMPNTARGGGISRKITNAADRKKLKEIAGSITVPEGAGLIIRTAGAKRTKAEIKRDYEYLQRLWEQIRELTLKSIAPAPIYEEGNLIKRSIRDLYSREIDEVLVEGEAGYRVAKDFMKMIMPSHAKNVKQYTDPLPLFARFQVESYLAGMFNPTVQLKSGGYIVIGITEALVAIDVNSGRSTKEGSIEDTALKTNLEAAEEIARQLRLRDLAGLIVIDFIDMEERKNNAAVEKRLKDKLKTDRARIQVGRISGFGLLEMSRQRLRPGMLEATTQPCPHCHGTGLIRSDDSLALAILRQLEEEGTRARSREVLLKAPVGIVNFLVNQKREHIQQIEARYGMAVRLEADALMVSPDFTLEKFKTASRPVVQTAPVISVDTSSMIEEEPEESVEETQQVEEVATTATDAPDEGRRKRRRRRRRRGGGNGGNGDAATQAESRPAGDEAASAEGQEQPAGAGADAPAVEAEATPAGGTEEEARPKRSRTRSRRKSAPKEEAAAAEPAPAPAEGAEADTGAPAAGGAADTAEAPAADASAAAQEEAPKPKRTRSRRKPAAAAEAQPDAAEAPAAEAPAEEEAPKPKRTRSRSRKKPTADAAAPAAEGEAAAAAPEAAQPAPEPPAEPAAAQPAPAPVAAAEAPAAPASEAPEPAEDAAPEEKPAPRRRGWWALRR